MGLMVKNNLKLLLPQKVKNTFIKEGLYYYGDKLKPYAFFEIIESKDKPHFKEHCQKMEKTTLTVVLDERGRQFNSVSFSKTWEQLTTQKVKGVSFIIGGPFGFDFDCRADITLSLSSLTLNHELAPLVLLEQVYRAYTLIQGLPYHHA